MKVGDLIVDDLPPIDFGRIAAQTAKQVIVQKVRESERKRQFEEFKDRKGEIINGLVKRVEFGNVTVDLGRGEALLRRDETAAARDVPQRRARARPHHGRARRTARAADLPVAHASAVHGQAVRPGSAGNLRRHHRDQGGRARSGQPRQDRRAVSATAAIDPVGACVGMRGSRVQAGGAGAAGREDRHHPLVAGPGDLRRQRAGAGGSLQGRAGRGFRPY